MRSPGWSSGTARPIYLAVALLTLGGLWALFTLPAGIYPEVTYPRIVVLARGGTFEAEEMTVAVTRPLEQALSGIRSASGASAPAPCAARPS